EFSISLKFCANCLVGLPGMFPGAVDDVQKRPAALNMAEKPVAEAYARVGAFDQPRYVGQHEFGVAAAHDAKLRVQGGERIVRDLRLCSTYGRQESGLSGIRKPDDAGICDQLQAQPDGEFFARLARIGMPRRAVGRGLEMRIA